MTRTKQIISFGSDIVGAEYEQTIRDTITPGLLVLNTNGYGIRNPGSLVVAQHPGTTQRSIENATWTMGFYPYHPAKMVFDRMRMNWRMSTQVGGAISFQYSLDSGTTFTTAVTNAAGAPAITSPSDLGSVTVTAGQQDVSLAGIDGFEYLVWQTVVTSGGADVIQWQAYVILYRLDLPFEP